MFASIIRHSGAARKTICDLNPALNASESQRPDVPIPSECLQNSQHIFHMRARTIRINTGTRQGSTTCMRHERNSFRSNLYPRIKQKLTVAAKPTTQRTRPSKAHMCRFVLSYHMRGNFMPSIYAPYYEFKMSKALLGGRKIRMKPR